jgi:hypothetical protein
MCTDFTSLNKACPKDNFPLPRIDKIVDSAAGCEVMSLLDCFSGYHQIYMKEEDKASTSFIMPFGTYCFVRMPKGLKNARSTFSRLTKTVLESQVGRNIFTYVCDIVVASKNKEDHLADLAETFTNMWEARLRLNPKKCVFGVRQGKILGYLVSHCGIEANPTKIQAIINMMPPQSTRDVQRLTGRLAASTDLFPGPQSEAYLSSRRYAAQKTSHGDQSKRQPSLHSNNTCQSWQPLQAPTPRCLCCSTSQLRHTRSAQRWFKSRTERAQLGSVQFITSPKSSRLPNAT